VPPCFGVPVSAPVVLFRLSPAGSAPGGTVHKM